MQMTKCRDLYFSYAATWWDFMIAQIIREISDRPKIIVVAEDVGEDRSIRSVFSACLPFLSLF